MSHLVRDINLIHASTLSPRQYASFARLFHELNFTACHPHREPDEGDLPFQLPSPTKWGDSLCWNGTAMIERPAACRWEARLPRLLYHGQPEGWFSHGNWHFASCLTFPCELAPPTCFLIHRSIRLAT
ncbi:unnamed protein product [Protopolystoma xenopodis]|uniref:Uncharacterized protein n=1 Tax=Protopolystoma xenopodis TaxID=117903 RepID=A0A3S5B4T3_9PLAT|nr:unnamed protein product [Protopolystoma xenopodis]